MNLPLFDKTSGYIINSNGKQIFDYSKVRQQTGGSCTFDAVYTAIECDRWNRKLPPLAINVHKEWSEAIQEQIKQDPNNVSTTPQLALNHYLKKGYIETDSYILFEEQAEVEIALKEFNLPAICVLFKGNTFTDNYDFEHPQSQQSGSGHTLAAVIAYDKDAYYGKDSVGKTAHCFPPTTKGYGFYRMRKELFWSEETYPNATPTPRPYVHAWKIIPLCSIENEQRAIERSYVVEGQTMSDWNDLTDDEKLRYSHILRGVVDDETTDADNKTANKYKSYIKYDPITKENYALYEERK